MRFVIPHRLVQSMWEDRTGYFLELLPRTLRGEVEFPKPTPMSKASAHNRERARNDGGHQKRRFQAH